MQAAREGQAGMSKLLIKCGANVHLTDKVAKLCVRTMSCRIYFIGTKGVNMSQKNTNKKVVKKV